MYTSPLDQFEINTLLSVSAPFLNIGLYLTNVGLFIIIGSLLLFSLFILPGVSLIPTKWSIAIESLYASLQGMVSDQIGDAQTQYIPLTLSIFTFILITNLAGNIPYSFIRFY